MHLGALSDHCLARNSYKHSEFIYRCYRQKDRKSWGDLNGLLRDSHLAVHVKRIATVTGKIISLSNCDGNVARLLSRNLYYSFYFDVVRLRAFKCI